MFLPPREEMREIIDAALRIADARIAGAETDETEAEAIVLKERIRRARAFMFGLLPESALKGNQS